MHVVLGEDEGAVVEDVELAGASRRIVASNPCPSTRPRDSRPDRRSRFRRGNRGSRRSSPRASQTRWMLGNSYEVDRSVHVGCRVEAREPSPVARERILDSAYDLFSTRGVRAVGIDEVIERAAVAKATLYRHFPSKDDLVLAFLQAARGGLDARLGRGRGAQARRDARGAAPRDLRSLRRVVPPGGLRGLLVRQRPARDRRTSSTRSAVRAPSTSRTSATVLRSLADEAGLRRTTSSRARSTSS